MQVNDKKIKKAKNIKLPHLRFQTEVAASIGFFSDHLNTVLEYSLQNCSATCYF